MDLDPGKKKTWCRSRTTSRHNWGCFKTSGIVAVCIFNVPTLWLAKADKSVHVYWSNSKDLILDQENRKGLSRKGIELKSYKAYNHRMIYLCCMCNCVCWKGCVKLEHSLCGVLAVGKRISMTVPCHSSHVGLYIPRSQIQNFSHSRRQWSTLDLSFILCMSPRQNGATQCGFWQGLSCIVFHSIWLKAFEQSLTLCVCVPCLSVCPCVCMHGPVCASMVNLTLCICVLVRWQLWVIKSNSLIRDSHRCLCGFVSMCNASIMRIVPARSLPGHSQCSPGQDK